MRALIKIALFLPMGLPVATLAQCNNVDFEATASGAYTAATGVTAWNISSGIMNGCTGETWTAGASEFSIATTPVSGFFMGSVSLPHSPLGGTQVALLNNAVNNYSKTKITTTFTVTPGNCIFTFAYAGVFASPGDCCSGVGLFMKMTPCSGGSLPCGTFTLSPSCNNLDTEFNTTGGTKWTSWKTKSVDLTPYIGTCVTVEVWCVDNAFGGQYARAAFDAQCGSKMGPGVNVISDVSPVSFCSGSNLAQLTAPPGYTSYSWTAASSLAAVPAAQATLASITVSNPFLGGVYTVSCSSPSVCTSTYVYSLTTTQVSVAGVSTRPSCAGGSAGSATVFGTGSSAGYSFVWTNSGNSVVSTASVASSLPPGAYTVTAAAAGSLACGTASLQVTINSGTTSPSFINAAYCGATAFLNAPPGANFQWYNGTSAITGATLSALTYTSPSSQSVVSVGFDNSGCRDSALIILQAVSPGSLSAAITGTGCAGSTNGSALVSFTPVAGATGNHSYTLFTSGTSPTVHQTGTLSSLSATMTGLVYGGSYSITVFDGICFAGTNIQVAPITPSLTVLPGPVHGAVCSGDTVALFAIITQPHPQYTFSWSPPTFINGPTTAQMITVSPTVNPGSTGTVIYSVVVTPTAASCPVTATYALNFAAAAHPTLSFVPDFCSSDPAFTITAAPSGGTIYPFTSGAIVPSQLSPGTHTIQYTTSSGSCTSTDHNTFVVHPLPSVLITGDSAICKGDSAFLFAAGADQYSWSFGTGTAPGASLTLIPSQSVTVVLTGTTSASGCSDSVTFQVGVIGLPPVSVTGSTMICAGESAVLSAGGASTYSWNSGQASSQVTVSPTGSHTYVVTGYDAETGCRNSYSFVLQVDACLALSDAETGPPFVFPNPFVSTLTVEITAAEANITITDLKGKTIYRNRTTAPRNEINLSELKPGVYLLRIQAAGSDRTVKLVRQTD